MRKLLLSLVACAATLSSASAVDLYIRGGNLGWTTADCKEVNKFTDNGNGTYTITVETLESGFKIADNAWGNNNWGSAKDCVLDQDYTLTNSSGSENITIKDKAIWSNVTITFNINTGVMRATGQAVAKDWSTVTLYLRGTLNEWNSYTDAHKFTYADGIFSLSLPSLTGEFKVGDANWGDQFGFECPIEGTAKQYITQSENNFYLEDTLTDVTIRLNPQTKVITIDGTLSGSDPNPVAPQAWIISAGVNGWDGAAVSDKVMTYDETTGLYTVVVDAASLRADETTGNGFKIGYQAVNNWKLYWGAPDNDKILENGVATPAYQGDATKNFIIAEDVNGNVTIVLNPAANTLMASWQVGQEPDPIIPDPVIADDTLTATVPALDINGETTVEVKLTAADGKSYVSGQWDLEIPAGFTVSDITLNKDVCPDHELLTNTVNGVIKCIAYSAANTPFNPEAGAMFTFTLKADGVEAGTANGAIKNIRFNIAPTADNTNIAFLFEDAQIAITTVKAVKSITAEPAAIALHVGDSQAITLTINPEDATDPSVTWSIAEGEDIVKLENGTVTALTMGVATIKIVANDGFGAETTIDVTVDGKPVENIELDITEKELYAGESFTIVATVTPEDATNTGVMWSSSDEAVATVDAEGKVTAVAAGEAVITATAKDGSGVNASCTVTVKARISGDADGDDNLTIQDIVIIAKASIDIMTEGMVEENMDLDGDGEYTSTDVTMAVYYLMQLDFTPMPAYAEVSTDMLKLSTPLYTDNGEMMLPIYLQGATTVAGIQFDIVLPNALVLGENSYVEPAASNGHSLITTKIADNTYRVVIYSANNFSGNELGYINVRPSAISMVPGMTDTKMDVDLNNVMYSDGVSLKATDNSRTTLDLAGIEAVFAANNGEAMDVYTPAGILVARQANASTIANLPAGIYVVSGKKVVKF